MKTLLSIAFILLIVTGCSDNKEAKTKALTNVISNCEEGSTVSITVYTGTWGMSVETKCEWKKQ